MLKTFKIGGIHPAANKLTTTSKIEKLPLPDSITILVSQHIGAPSKVIVNKGDKVKVGQLVATSSGFVSANIHSSVSGTVSKIEMVTDSSGYKKEAIVVNVEGDEWDESIDRSSEIVANFSFDAKYISDKIVSSGIVGLGGATFPTHVKLTPPTGTKAEVLIINGAECEPYLTADHRLMIEKGEEILIGTKLLMKTLGVEKAVIGIENNKPDAIRNITELTKKYTDITVCPLQVKYPQGGEKQLIKAVTGHEVPSGALPISVGAVVNNVGTAFAVYEAVIKNKPLFERVITVTGKSFSKPSNFLVRLGTPVGNLIEAAGGMPNDVAKVVMGGPMMGKSITSVDIPVSKGTSGILVIDENEGHRNEIQNCIRCGRCIEACPMGLEPYLLMPLAENKRWSEMEALHIMDCIECGSCTYTCPANRPILDYLRLGKSTVGTIIRNRK